jgi:hypothetical protein
MNKTIRDYIKRRVWWCAGVAACGWLMFPLGAVIARSLPHGAPEAIIPIAGMILFGGAILALQRIVRCPTCKARLGQTIAMPLAFSWGSGPKINFCPYCGVSLEQELPLQPYRKAPTQSLDPIK